MKRRILAVVMSLSMILSVTGTDVYATEGDTSSGNLIVYEAEDEAASEELSEELVIENDYEELTSNEDNSEALDVSEDENTANKDTVIEKDNDGVVSANKTDSTKENNAIEEIEEELLAASSEEGYTQLAIGSCGDGVYYKVYDTNNDTKGDYLIIGLTSDAGTKTCAMTDGYNDGQVHGNEYLSYSNTITKVKMEDGVTHVGDYAFYGLNKLESVEIASSVKSIGGSAFGECSSLPSVTMPNNLDTIGAGAFSGCTSLSELSIPNTVSSIGNQAFSGCTKLSSINIPSSLTDIDGWFMGCSGLSNITIPNTVTSISSHAFNGCSNLSNITIPESVTYIGAYAFKGCSKLSTVTIPDSVKSIGDGAFAGCTGLKKVVLGKGITIDKIKATAFSGVGTSSNRATLINTSSIPNSYITNSETWDGGYFEVYTSNVIKDSTATTTNGSFSLSTDSQNVTTDADGNMTGVVKENATVTITPSPDFGYETEYVYYKAGSSSGSYIYSPDSNGCYSFFMPETDEIVTVSIKFMEAPRVTEDGFKFAFLDTDDPSEGVSIIYTGSKTSITIPEKIRYCGNDYPVKALGTNSNQIPTNLESVTIPNSVTEIKSSAFYNCQNLKGIVIPDSVTGIGDSAFGLCTGLKFVIIGKGVEKIGAGAFNRVGLGEPAILLNKSTTIASPSGSTVQWKNGNFNVVKSNVIKDSTSNGSFSLSSDNITTDADGNLTDVVTKGAKVTITPIADDGYMIDQVNYCIGNDSEGVTCDGPDSNGCFSFVMPDTDAIVTVSVTFIDASDRFEVRFLDSDNPSEGVYVKYKGSDANVVIPSKIIYNGTLYDVKKIGNYAFEKKSNLKCVVIPNSITTIGNYAFSGCTSLEYVVIPNNITTIEHDAFSGCTSLESVTIPNSISNINNSTFNGCTKLKNVTIEDGVSYISDGAFKNCASIKTITIPASIVFISNNSFEGVGTASSPAILINKSERFNISTSGTTAWKGGYFVLSNVLKASTSNGSFSLSANNVSVDADGSFTDIVDAGAEVTIVPVPDLGYVVDTVSYSLAGNAGPATCTGPDTDGKYSFTMPDSDKFVTVSMTFKSGPALKLDGFSFQATDSSNGVAIAGYDGSDSNVIIPEKVTYNGREYTVTEIGEKAFYQNKALQTVTIPNSVTAINKQAFCQCENLQSIIIPDSVTSIGVSAFDFCKGLKQVILGTGLKTIGENAFDGVGSVNGTRVPALLINKSPDITGPTSSEEKWYGGYFVTNNVIKTAVSHGSFKLSSENVSTDDDGNFIGIIDGGAKVTIVPVPDFGYEVDIVSYSVEGDSDSVTCQGPDADGNYSFIMPDTDKKITVGVTFKKIPKTTSDGYDFLFINDNDPTEGICISWYSGSEKIIVIPDKINYSGTEFTVKSIDKRAFADRNIISVSIPDSVTEIGIRAFINCYSLKSITIGKNVSKIGEGAFDNVGSKITTYLLNSSQVNSPTSKGDSWYGGNFTPVTSNVIKEETATDWGDYELRSENVSTDDNGNLTGIVSGGATVTIVPKPKFGIETAFVSIYPTGGNYTSLKPDTNGNYSFTMPDTGQIVIVSVGFNKISKDTPDGFSYEFIDFDNPDEGVCILNYLGSANNVAIPDKVNYLGKEYPVKSIGVNAFSSCTSLNSITIPTSVNSIENNAFYNCTNLNSITIPTSVNSIGDYAFNYCTSLNSITIPTSVKSIGNCAFIDCYSLESITIPESVITIGSDIVDRCYKLSQVVNNSNQGISYHYGNSWYYINEGTKVTITDNIIPANTTVYAGELTNTAKVVDTSLTIGDKIGVNLYMSLPDNVVNGGYVLINNKLQDIPDQDATGLYKFTTWTNAKNLDDDITVRILNNEYYYIPFENGETRFIYSARTYINKAKKSNDAKMKALAEALDVYGYCAQDYFGYNAPATTPAVDTSADLSSYAMTSTGLLPEGFNYLGSSLILESDTSIKHYFRIADEILWDENSENTFTFLCSEEKNINLQRNDGEAKEIYLERIDDSDIYFMKIPYITATDLGKPYTISFIKNDNEECIYSMSYSAMSYCNKAVNSDNDKLKKLAYSLYNFYKASDAYTESLTKN